MEVKESKAKNKRFVAIFSDGKKVNFGQKNPKIGTYIGHKDKKIRSAWRARHEPTEKKFYGDPRRPATLSAFLLWGEATTLKDAIKDYINKFNLK